MIRDLRRHLIVHANGVRVPWPIGCTFINLYSQPVGLGTWKVPSSHCLWLVDFELFASLSFIYSFVRVLPFVNVTRRQTDGAHTFIENVVLPTAQPYASNCVERMIYYYLWLSFIRHDFQLRVTLSSPFVFVFVSIRSSGVRDLSFSRTQTIYSNIIIIIYRSYRYLQRIRQ